jgi:hypothetical protein
MKTCIAAGALRALAFRDSALLNQTEPSQVVFRPAEGVEQALELFRAIGLSGVEMDRDILLIQRPIRIVIDVATPLDIHPPPTGALSVENLDQFLSSQTLELIPDGLWPCSRARHGVRPGSAPEVSSPGPDRAPSGSSSRV